MNRTRGLVTAVLVTVLLFGGLVICDRSAATAKEITLRLVIPSPADDKSLTYQAVEMAKRFNARAKGQYKIEVYPGGTLAKLPEYFDSVRVGAIEMACVDWGIFSFLDPRLGLVSTPFLVDTLEGSNYMLKVLLPLHDAIFQEKFNAKALGMYSTDGGNLVSNKPIRTLEDLKGLLVAAPSTNTSALFKGLGSSPVNIMWTDLFEALQKKTVDASAMTLHGAIVTNLMDACDYMTLFFGHPNFNGYTINLDVWKKMPKNIQTMLEEEINQACKWMEVSMIQSQSEDVRYLRERGKNVYAIPKAERNRWVTLLVPHRDKQMTSFGDFGLKIKQIAEEANKRFPYTGQVPQY
jgi:TRAP-type C4-dicarboxylate transport system substrate-binding protein